MSRRWQDGAILLLGIWAIASPWIFAGAMHNRSIDAAETVTQNFWTVGVLVMALASAALSTFSSLVEAGNGVVGAWLVVSPWALHFSDSTPLMWNAVLIGIAVSLLAMLGLAKSCRDLGVVRLRER